MELTVGRGGERLRPSTDNFTSANVERHHQGEIQGARRACEGFTGGSVVKNPPANAGGTGSIPGLG